MKRCPNCGTELPEEARFCIHCMTVLNEKTFLKPYKLIGRWLRYSAIALLVCICLILTILVAPYLYKPGDSGNSDVSGVPGTESTEKTESGTAVSDWESGEKTDTGAGTSDGESENSVSEETTDPGAGEDTVYTDSEPNDTSGTESDRTTHTTDRTTNKGTNSTTDKTTNKNTNSTTNSMTNKNTNKPTNTTTDKATHTQTSQTTDTSDPEEAPWDNFPGTAVANGIEWSYRPAASSDYSTSYSSVALSNAITIDGFNTLSPDGVYKIPETLNGRTVVAISANSTSAKYTFRSGSVKNNVKQVYLPKNLFSVLPNTFSQCANLSDIYYSGEMIYLPITALPHEISKEATFHCSESCRRYPELKTMINSENPYSTGTYTIHFRIWTGSDKVPPITWEYRGATLEEYPFERNGISRLNAITITDVKGLSEDGTYVIPQTINGKTVVAFAPGSSFSAKWRVETVKKVYLPPTVTFFLKWGTNALSDCYYLTDLYIAAESISIIKENLPKKLNASFFTIHCSDSCYFEDYGKTAKEFFPFIHEDTYDGSENYPVYHQSWNGSSVYK